MMKNASGLLANVLTGILTLCAVLITIAAVRREFFAPPVSAEPAAYPKPRVISNGASLATAGNVLGSRDAPLKIVEFSDFQCPFCKDMATTLQTLEQRYPGRVTVVYRHFPLRIHPHAREAAVAAECAAAQGQFAAYHNLLFARQDSIGVTSWERLAVEAGIRDTSSFHACRSERWALERLAADSVAANTIQLTGTPSLVIENEALGAAVPLDTLESWIRRVAPNVLKERSVARQDGGT
jgi:protein-disulfide isomerase